MTFTRITEVPTWPQVLQHQPTKEQQHQQQHQHLVPVFLHGTGNGKRMLAPTTCHSLPGPGCHLPLTAPHWTRRLARAHSQSTVNTSTGKWLLWLSWCSPPRHQLPPPAWSSMAADPVSPTQAFVLGQAPPPCLVPTSSAFSVPLSKPSLEYAWNTRTGHICEATAPQHPNLATALTSRPTPCTMQEIKREGNFRRQIHVLMCHHGEKHEGIVSQRNSSTWLL